MSKYVVAIYRPDGSGRIDGFQVVEGADAAAVASARRAPIPGEEWSVTPLIAPTHRAVVAGEPPIVKQVR